MFRSQGPPPRRELEEVRDDRCKLMVNKRGLPGEAGHGLNGRVVVSYEEHTLSGVLYKRIKANIKRPEEESSQEVMINELTDP